MSLRFSNKDWPKELEQIYYDRFLSDYRNGQFVVPNDIFSIPDVLDCLENEINSAQAVAKLVKNLFYRGINSVLIVGSGSGRLGTQIRALLPLVNLIEIDKNQFVIERLQNKHKNDIMRKSYHTDVCHMPFDNDSIDVIICYSVFRYIENLNMALDELMRVVKKDGKVIIAEAKDFYTIEKIKKILNIKNISFKRGIIPSVRLPHLTFYYYLLTQYTKDKIITEFINERRIITNTSYYQSAFELAGSSLGSIYTLVLEKSI